MKSLFAFAVVVFVLTNLPYGCEQPADPTGQDEAPKDGCLDGFCPANYAGRTRYFIRGFGECIDGKAKRIGDQIFRTFHCEKGIVRIPIGDERMPRPLHHYPTSRDKKLET